MGTAEQMTEYCGRGAGGDTREVHLRWISIPSRGSHLTPTRFHATDTGESARFRSRCIIKPVILNKNIFLLTDVNFFMIRSLSF